MIRIGFIGAGAVGTALGLRLKEQGFPVTAVADRDGASATRFAGLVASCRAFESNQGVVEAAELVFVTTPDDAIAQVVWELGWRAGRSVVHCSGAASTDILEPARAAGAQVGTFHPLQSFADPDRALENLPGSTFAIEAEGELLRILKKIAESLGGKWIVLKPADKAIYHAAAVLAGNYPATLVQAAADLWWILGIPSREAVEALLPLVRGAVANIADQGLTAGLTGPIARGDVGTIRKHLQALEERAPELLPAYRELGKIAIPIALDKGEIDESSAKEMRKLLAQP